MRYWHDVHIALPPGATGEVRTTCPQCAPSRRTRDTSLAVHVDRGCWYCFYCGWKGSLHGRKRGEPMPGRMAPQVAPDPRKQAVMERLWHTARCITTGDPVHRYLLQRRLTHAGADIPPVLRYHPHVVYRHADGSLTSHPAMVAVVQAPDGTLVNIHRTYLTHAGVKAAVPTVKKLMPPAVPGDTRGGAIRLFPAGETLAVTEGIETGLAVHLGTGLPAWAAIAASNMRMLVVPETVRLVVIGADHDTAGLEAAKALARRMLAAGRRVKILTPACPGRDWADTREAGYV